MHAVVSGLALTEDRSSIGSTGPDAESCTRSRRLSLWQAENKRFIVGLFDFIRESDRHVVYTLYLTLWLASFGLQSILKLIFITYHDPVVPRHPLRACKLAGSPLRCRPVSSGSGWDGCLVFLPSLCIPWVY